MQGFEREMEGEKCSGAVDGEGEWGRFFYFLSRVEGEGTLDKNRTSTKIIP